MVKNYSNKNQYNEGEELNKKWKSSVKKRLNKNTRQKSKIDLRKMAV